MSSQLQSMLVGLFVFPLISNNGVSNKSFELLNMSEYNICVRGPLKLKGDAGIKKKKKKKDEKKMLEQVSKSVEVESKKNTHVEVQKTKAELAFLKQQEKMQEERIKKKASMTHKQRVEEFNRHLDSLTEHFDIPKVSWTK